MEIDSNSSEHDEYVLLDFDGVAGVASLSPNAPYTLSGLDTLNPIMIIDNKLKLIGEYEETIGTCFVFDERNKSDSESREANPSQNKTPKNTKQSAAAAKEIKPTARLHKILKFRLFEETAMAVDSQQ